ncbi:MAG TPA: S9 family peptidase [Pseudomonadales bacterium]|nr:S9 family peptidase [Pseudomonadales bacterium]
MAAKKSLKTRPLNQDDLFKAKYVCDAVLSPDGRLAVYALSGTTGSGEKEAQRQSLWTVPVAGGKSRQLTHGKGSSYSPQFSDDGATLYFLSSRDGRPQIYAMPTDGGEAEAVTSLEQGVAAFKVAANGTLVFSALTQPPKKPSDDDHQRIDRFWFRFDPLMGNLEDMKQSLFVAKPGGKPRVLSNSDGLILSFAVSKDGKQVAWLVTGLHQHEFVHTNLITAPINGRAKPHTLLEDRIFVQVDWHPSGESLLVAGQMAGIGDIGSLMTVDARSGRISNRTAPLDLTFGTAFQGHIPARCPGRTIVDTDGKHVYACISRGGTAHPHRISLSGKVSATPIGEDTQRVDHLMDMHGDNLLIISQTTNEPPALFALDRRTLTSTRLTAHNDDWHRELRWPTVEHLIVKVKKGVDIEGWVLKPHGARVPCKTILTIHGGPHGGYGCTFWEDMHQLVGAGYAVAFMNPRGSTGYGKEFQQSIFGSWGYPELEDFNAFLDELVKRKIAHPDKLGVTGISGGGHLSSWLIGHTNRFSAAVPEQGVYNMISMWGVSDAGQILIDLELQSRLHKDPMKYWKHSPMAYADKCKTPTLLLQGQDDVRCPISQAEEYFSALKHFGCEAELIRMKQCNHGAQVGGRPTLRRFRMNAMKDWFDRHIG